MAEPVALVALAMDAAVGWPPRLYALMGHPVGAMARAIGLVERMWNRPATDPRARRGLGVLAIVIVVSGTATLFWLAGQALHLLLGRWAWIGIAAAAWPALAQRSLDDHVRPVGEALGRGDLRGARAAVARIVGRDTDALDGAGVARAAIESLAESFCDGVVAPLCWLLVAGLPGVWAYKAVNTADSLMGHREARWRAFGWAAARSDDLANLLPARVAAVLLCLAGGGGWRVMWRDRRRHASPNAGWPEAAMAGTLGVALAGPVAYDGAMLAKPWIGQGGQPACAADVERALRVYRRACVLLWIIAGGVAWLR